MPEPEWHRIHPLTLIIEGWKSIRQFFIVFAFFIYSMFSGTGSEESRYELLAAGVGAFVILIAAVRYFSFRYAVNDGKLLIRSGILTKNLRTIPLDRIQNINVSRTFLHRVLGLVDLEIETASGSKAEAAISALMEDKANTLRAELLEMREEHHSEASPGVKAPPTKKTVYKPSNKELFLVGASENKLLAIVGAILGIQFVMPALMDTIEKSIKNPNFSSVSQSAWMLFVVIGFGMLFFGWIASIISTFVKYYGFEITEEGNRLKRKYGLLTQFENVIPIRRVQAMVHSQNWLQKYLNISKLYVSTAGSFGSDKKQGDAQLTSSPLLTPVLRDDAFPNLANLVFPGRRILNPVWNPVGKNTILRHIRSSLLVSFAIGIGLWFVMKWWAVLVVCGFLGVAYLSGRIYFQNAKWADEDHVVISKRGWLTKKRTYLPVEKVQAVVVRQSPVQRFLSLSTVGLISAAPTFQETELDDLTLEDAHNISQSVHKRSGESRDSLVDGF